MSVKINHIDDRKMTVNGKEVYQDTNDNWVAREELTVTEAAVFSKHLRSLQHED